MRWTKRVLWLAAWGAWVWCGARLYEELPRDLGPVVSVLQLEQTEVLLGFLGDQHEVVARPRLLIAGATPQTYSVYDATSGERVRRMPDNRLRDGRDGLSVSTSRSYSHQERGERVFADPWYYGMLRVPERLRTVAIKEDETRRLIVREWDRETLLSEFESPDRTLLVMPDGIVHRLPRVVNWPLLLFCQSLPALPLILLWLALLWRRKRRERGLAGAKA